jgi:hypothetical protein
MGAERELPRTQPKQAPQLPQLKWPRKGAEGTIIASSTTPQAPSSREPPNFNLQSNWAQLDGSIHP